jgi:HSP20 family protein
MLNVLRYYPIRDAFDEIVDTFFKDSKFFSMTSSFDDDIFSKKFESYFPSYPVSNNYVTDDGTSVIEVAIPGMSKKDIAIKVEGDILFIIGENKNEEEKKGIYLHRKLAKRKFDISFKCSSKQNLDMIEASIEDGLLVIQIPLKEESKPKVRQISIK